MSARIPEFLRELGFPAKTKLESRWTTVNGHMLHSRSGAGASGEVPFVLIHGLVISSLYMIPLAERLADENSVHALDLPSFGRSRGPREVLSIPQLAEWVVAWISEMRIERCHIVANSMGCEVAAHIAVKAPQTVISLVLIGPTLDPQAFALTTQIFRLLRDAIHEPARLWMNWFFDFCRAGFRRSIGTTRAMFRDHIEEQLPMIRARTLVIRGSRDPTVPQRAAEEMTRLLGAGTMMAIEHQFHCVHYTDPETVHDAVIRHARFAG